MSKHYRRFKAEDPEPKEAQQGKCQDLDFLSAFNSYCFIHFPVLVISGSFVCDCRPYLRTALGTACVPQGKQQSAQGLHCRAQHRDTQDLCCSTLRAFNSGIHHLALVHFITDILGSVVSQCKRLSEKAAEFLEWLFAACLSGQGNKEPSVLLWKKTQVRPLSEMYYRFKKQISFSSTKKSLDLHKHQWDHGLDPS